MPAEQIEINIDYSEMMQLFNRFEKELPNVLRSAMLESFRIVGNTAVSDFMKKASLIGDTPEQKRQGKLTKRSPGDPLNIRTEKLMRSLIGAHSFAGGSSGVEEGIREIKISNKQVKGFFGSEVPYAAIHEYGGTIHRTNLFGRGISATINMPARPYLNPALDKSEPDIQSTFNDKIQSFAARQYK